MIYQAMKRHRGTLNAYYYMRETNLKSLRTVWCQLYDILVKVKLQTWQKVQ